ncbi:MAG: hypothetical protein ABS955_06000 [Stenotrophomonas maltophilia]
MLIGDRHRRFVSTDQMMEAISAPVEPSPELSKAAQALLAAELAMKED